MRHQVHTHDTTVMERPADVPGRLDLDAYLARIGLVELPPPTAEGLRELVRAQVLGIAFENLDVLAGIPVRLDEIAVDNKILGNRRGGYCYELNGLLARALRIAGFEVRNGLARVTYRRTEPGPLSHQILMVECAGKTWLVDVGFGGPGLIEPMRMLPGEMVEQGGTRFRLQAEQDGELLLQREMAGVWVSLYRIASTAATSLDLVMANHFVSTYPNSPFRTRFMCVKPLLQGWWQIEGSELVQMDAQYGVVQRRRLADARDLRFSMQEIFGIELMEVVAQAAWMRVAAERIASNA